MPNDKVREQLIRDARAAFLEELTLVRHRDVLLRVVAERERQDAKWGEQNHAPLKWSVILTEECGEVAKAALESESGECGGRA